MDIKELKAQRAKQLTALAPVAEDKMIRKTNAELNLGGFNLHYYFLRFFFSVVSYGLYLPTLIDFFQASYSANEYIRNIIICLLLLGLEVGSNYQYNAFFTRKRSINPVNKISTYIVIGICSTSIILSCFGGINAIDITDNSSDNIINTSRTEKKQDVTEYMNLLKSNDNLITQNQNVIRENNVLISDKNKIALTKAGKRQIESLNTRNKELSEQNKELLLANNDIRKQMNDVRITGDKLMDNKLDKSWKKTMIYMIIFFFAGLIAEFGKLYSYNYIAVYYRDLHKGMEHIEVLQDYWEECQETDLRTKERRAMVTKQIQLKHLEIDKAINDAKMNQWTLPDAEETSILDEKKKQFPNTNHRELIQ